MIYTGYYANIKHLQDRHQYSLVSISRGNPSWMAGRLADMDLLKPPWEMVMLAKNLEYGTFVDEYRKMLSGIRIGDVVDNLRDESILLCYEKEFCHRHLVREWLRSYGILCREIRFSEDGKAELL